MTKQELTETIASTLHMCAWASFYDELHSAYRNKNRDKDGQYLEMIEGYEKPFLLDDLPHAGSGEDWANHSPPVTPAALEKAAEIVEAIWPQVEPWIKRVDDEVYVSVMETFGYASESQTEKAEAYNTKMFERFGHCVAMQSMGHGVGLTDFRWEWRDSGLPEDFELPKYMAEDFCYSTLKEALSGETA